MGISFVLQYFAIDAFANSDEKDYCENGKIFITMITLGQFIICL